MKILILAILIILTVCSIGAIIKGGYIIGWFTGSIGLIGMYLVNRFCAWVAETDKHLKRLEENKFYVIHKSSKLSKKNKKNGFILP